MAKRRNRTYSNQVRATRVVLGVLVIVAIDRAVVGGQDTTPRFAVASVKQHRERVDPLAGGRRGGLCMGSDTAVTAMGGLTIGPDGVIRATTGDVPFSPGTCSFARTTLDEIIATAYSVPRSEVERLIVGGPSWLREDHFDIEARADKPRPRADLERMLQALLAERFGLRAHRETRQVDGFALQTVDGQHRLRVAESSAPPVMRTSEGTLNATAVPMERLARFLSDGLAKPVVDQTELTDRFTFVLTWTPAEGEMFLATRFFLATGSPATPAPEGSGPSLFTALQEQLGLRLHPQKVPVAVLVIDAVNHPTPN